MGGIERRAETLGLILRQGFLPNLIKDRLDPFRLAAQAIEVGVRCMEVSCRRDDTMALVPKLKERFPDMRFGVSSLIEDGAYFDFLQRRGPRFPSIRQAVEAGADFLVSVIAFTPRTYQRYPHLPVVPGVQSPQEAREQLDLGAGLIKFCLRPGGDATSYVKTAFHSGPLHFGVPLLLTGGIRPEKVDALVEAGMLVGVSGFDLILRGQYDALQQDQDDQAVRNAMQAYVEAFAAAREKHLPDVDFASADAVRIQEQSGRFMNVRPGASA